VWKDGGKSEENTMEKWEKLTESAERLGIDRKTVWRWARKGKIRHKRMGKIYMVASADIDTIAMFGTTESPAPEDARLKALQL
jgi:excisionase family DNA binding protein